MKPLVSSFAAAVLFALFFALCTEGRGQLRSRDYLPVPAGCVNIGPNLVFNPEFELGNVGFMSSFNFRADGVCYWGDYTIARTVSQPQNNCYDIPPTYIPSRDFPSYQPAGVRFDLRHIWRVSNRLDSAGNPFPGDGLFMIVDPCDPLASSLTDSCSATDPTDGRIWQQTIYLCSGEDYAFSVFAKNIYALDAYQWPGADVQPDFELSINGDPITNYFVDGVEGQNGSYELPQDNFADSTRWYQISGVYSVPVGVDSVTLVIRNLVQGKDGNDLALDGMFFGLCGKSIELNLVPVVPQCTQLNTIRPLPIRADSSTQNSGWRYYEWTKNGIVRDSGVLNAGDLIPEFITPADTNGEYFGDYQLITYADPDPNTSCGNGSQVITIIDSCDDTFPVEMGDLQGRIYQRKAQLAWETFSELNNKGFEVQYSTDRRSFTEMGFVEGVGTSQETHSYSFESPQLSIGTHYFRLRQVDIDGGFSFSNTIELTVVATDVLFSMYPNPSNDLAKITVEAMNEDQLSIEVISPLGQKVQTVYRGPIAAGQKVDRTIDTSQLPAGVYHVLLRGSRSRETHKLMVIH